VIYKIERDGYKFKELDLEVSDIIDAFPENIDYLTAQEFCEHNISLSTTWTLLKTEFSDIEGNENLIPDICAWIDSTLLLSPKAKRLLGDTLSEYGEFLPIMIDDEKYKIFNCLTLRDTENSNDLVFKTSDSNCAYLYCQQRLKDLVEELDLRGVMFSS
jgi:hypothetical protein